MQAAAVYACAAGAEAVNVCTRIHVRAFLISGMHLCMRVDSRSRVAGVEAELLQAPNCIPAASRGVRPGPQAGRHGLLADGLTRLVWRGTTFRSHPHLREVGEESILQRQ